MRASYICVSVCLCDTYSELCTIVCQMFQSIVAQRRSSSDYQRTQVHTLTT